MADITRLKPQLFTGAAVQDADDVQALVDAGITADIDLRHHGDLQLDPDGPLDAGRLLDEHPLIEYLHNGTRDDGAPKPVSWFETSWDFALPLLMDGAVLLCHCMNGHNRGPSTAAFFLMAYYGMSEAEAFALITERRPVATLRYLPDATGAVIALDLNVEVLGGNLPAPNTANVSALQR